MDSYIPDIESTATKVALAFSAYKSDSVRLVERNLAGFTHIVASRQGLYVVNERQWRLIAHGFFFGITFQGDDLLVFETCDLPRGPTRHGRLIRLEVRDRTIVDAVVLAKGLDNGCHQIDMIDGKLIVVDTYNQEIVRFTGDWTAPEIIHPLPVSATGRWTGKDPGYGHVNSVLAVGERILLLLHNGGQHTNRPSEIVVCDQGWREQERWALEGSGCHGLALLEDGTLLTCGSMEGCLIGADGFRLHVSPCLTRGLAVGEDTIVVGASELATREGRLRNSGTITFLNRDYVVRTVLNVPGAPTEIRRLDGNDAGLSNYLRTVAWGSTPKPGKRSKKYAYD